MKMLLVFLASLFFASSAISATVEEDVEHYVRLFKGDISQHAQAAESFVWKGLSDTRIFDVVEQRLLADAETARDDKQQKNRVAYYIRALGFSGQAKYLPTINQFVTDGVYERYAKAALVDLPQYRLWNPIITNRASFDPKLGDDTNRIMNMLRANDFMLKRLGAKRVYFKHQEPEVLELLAQELRTNYAKATPETEDAVAWMVKALGQARMEKHKPLIEEIALNTLGSKVGKYANAALENYTRKGTQ